MRVTLPLILILAFSAALHADDAAAIARGEALLKGLGESPPKTQTLRMSVFFGGVCAGTMTMQCTAEAEGFVLSSVEEVEIEGLIKSSGTRRASYNASLVLLKSVEERADVSKTKTRKSLFVRRRVGDRLVQKGGTFVGPKELEEFESAAIKGPIVLPQVMWPVLVSRIDLTKPGKLILAGAPALEAGGAPSQVVVTVGAPGKFSVRGAEVPGTRIDFRDPSELPFSVVVSPQRAPLLCWYGAPEQVGDPIYVVGTEEQVKADRAPKTFEGEEAEVRAVFSKALLFMSGKLPEAEVDSVFDWAALHKADPSKGASPKAIREKMIARSKKRPLPEGIVKSVRSLSTVKIEGERATILMGAKEMMTLSKGKAGWRVVKVR